MSTASLKRLGLAVGALALGAQSGPAQTPGGINPDCEKALTVARCLKP